MLAQVVSREQTVSSGRMLSVFSMGCWEHQRPDTVVAHTSLAFPVRCVCMCENACVCEHQQHLLSLNSPTSHHMLSRGKQTSLTWHWAGGYPSPKRKPRSESRRAKWVCFAKQLCNLPSISRPQKKKKLLKLGKWSNIDFYHQVLCFDYECLISTIQLI